MEKLRLENQDCEMKLKDTIVSCANLKKLGIRIVKAKFDITTQKICAKLMINDMQRN